MGDATPNIDVIHRHILSVLKNWRWDSLVMWSSVFKHSFFSESSRHWPSELTRSVLCFPSWNTPSIYHAMFFRDHLENISMIRILGTGGKVLSNENSALFGCFKFCFASFNLAKTAREPQYFQEVQQSLKISNFPIVVCFPLRLVQGCVIPGFLKRIKCKAIPFVERMLL